MGVRVRVNVRMRVRVRAWVSVRERERAESGQRVSVRVLRVLRLRLQLGLRLRLGLRLSTRVACRELGDVFEPLRRPGPPIGKGTSPSVPPEGGRSEEHQVPMTPGQIMWSNDAN